MNPRTSALFGRNPIILVPLEVSGNSFPDVGESKEGAEARSEKCDTFRLPARPAGTTSGGDCSSFEQVG